jgi:hypothetical protein
MSEQELDEFQEQIEAEDPKTDDDAYDRNRDLVERGIR